MNKAFVREPDAGEARCPLCGTLGRPVGQPTLSAFVVPEALRDIATTAYFCDFPRCEAAYFDDFERHVPVSALQRPVWPKSPDAPICGCFGLTADDVAADVREGGVARVKAAVARANGPDVRCLRCAADGRSCAAEIQRLYFKLKSTAG